ncbi:hypothetical protein ETH_00016565 [Eimeria tenella]|uniref:Uncharacterized protein n=1 Tax=Eimeria tenella TaxID=5802 RepID=U6KMV3_EIMTE|nr:hypothetical protein ETH_00016565 [Eimeria tenella]CDJ38156.1 hypothetical protein ETH_00016565 [Eimeria tenella]|eukprot:XP_013228994.1 hypothetical protein ETH_00016565 [Eimeria tenella]
MTQLAKADVVNLSEALNRVGLLDQRFDFYLARQWQTLLAAEDRYDDEDGLQQQQQKGSNQPPLKRYG